MTAATSGHESVAIGFECLEAVTTSGNTTAIGYRCGEGMTTGSNNTLLGHTAGNHDTTLTTGHQNTIIGARSNTSGSDSLQEAVIGYNITGAGSRTFKAGGSNGAYNEANNSAWSTTSDQRIKKNITNNTTGLDKINQITVRNFEYKTEDEIKTDNAELTDVVKHAVVNKEGTQVGSIAQEIESILPDVVRTNEFGIKSVDTSNITWYMINAIKELSTKVTALETENTALKARVTTLEGS
mgnify:FL=1